MRVHPDKVATGAVDDCEIIDFHIHMFPDHLASYALSRLLYSPDRRAASVSTSDGTALSTRAFLGSLGVVKACVMNIATKAHSQSAINDWANRLDRSFFIPFGAIHPASEDIERELDRIVSMGFPGVKLQPMFQDFHVLDRCFLRLCGLCEERGLIMLLHTGAKREDNTLIFAHPEDTVRIKSSFPRLKLVLPHYGCQRRWDLAEEFIIGREIYIDISHTLGYLEPARARRMILAHPRQYILFGSDCPLQNTAKTLAFLRALELPSSLLEDILAGNAKKLFALDRA